jgi:hypothetical protein
MRMSMMMVVMRLMVAVMTVTLCRRIDMHM